MTDNLLYCGDNLDILRRYIKDETVELIYPDPPFNSNVTYNVLFGGQNGSQAAAQIKPFEVPLDGKTIDMPPVGQVSVTVKKAPKAKSDAPHQLPLED